MTPRGAPRALLLALPLALSLWCACSHADEARQEKPGPRGTSFTVTIRERAGIARRGEPTRVSLPFAVGVLKDASDVSLAEPSGRPVPAQFEVLARWDDKSIRWLLARFFVDVAANGKITLVVRRGVGSSAMHGPNLVSKTPTNLVVDTGAIRAVVGAAHCETFLVTDRDGKALLKQRPQLVLYSPTGVAHRCACPDTVDLEQNGPLYASVFLAGPMKGKEPGVDKLFRYETRLHFWKGLGRVLAEHTVVAVGSAKDGVTIVDGIVVDMKAISDVSKYVFAGKGRAHPGSLRAGQTARLKQTCAYWHESGSGPDGVAEPVRFVVLEADFGYALTTNGGRAMAEGQRADGWLWAAGAERSVGVAVRDFWEEGPKALRVGADGSLAVECYAHWQAKPGEPRPPRARTPDYSKHPKLARWSAGLDGGIEEVVKRFLADTGYTGPVRRGPFRFGQGRAKTTDVLYLFGKADRQQIEIDTLAAHRRPLIPVVDPRYLASTRALPFVWLAASDSNLPVFEQGLLDMFENWQRHATRYGFLHFGDDQCSFGYNKTVPSTTDDQEYDTTQCLTMQFARTGNPDYLRWADVCARHFMDVDQVHPTGELHFHGYTAGGDYHEEPVRVDMSGHPYIGGIVNHYMLTGDRRSLRGIRRLAGALRGYGLKARERVLTTDERSLARAGICLAAIYDLTRDPNHLAPVKRMADAINDLAGDVSNDLRGEPPFHMWWINPNEMCYHVRELLVRYHMATGDPRALATLRKALDLYIYNLWDSQKVAWRGMFGAPFDFNMQYENAVPREPRRGTATELATAELGLPFAYLARVTGNDFYLTPILESMDNLGHDYAKRFGNRQFARRQLWSLPLVSMLPRDWRANRDRIIQREVLRASLKADDGLRAWTPKGQIEGKAHGEILWADSPFGRVLRTYRNGFVTFPAPKDVLETPGTVCFWVRRDAARWNRKPWPWYGELRGLLYIGSDARQTNALDLMMLKSDLWTRLYDHRAWEMVAIRSPSVSWEKGQWHHVGVVWNRFDLTVLVNGEEVGHDDRFALPNGGQTTIALGWRPTNRYGQANYYDLRVFQTALSTDRIRRIYEFGRPDHDGSKAGGARTDGGNPTEDGARPSE